MACHYREQFIKYVLKARGASLLILPVDSSPSDSTICGLVFFLLLLYCSTTGRLYISSLRRPSPHLVDAAHLKGEAMTTDASGLVHHVGFAHSLNVAISICLTYTLIFTCVRVHLRRSSFGADDAVVVVATLAALAHFAASYTCLTAGLGKPYNMIKENVGRLSSVRSRKTADLRLTS